VVISFMGFSIPIVRRRGVILCKGRGKGCGFPGPGIGTWGTRPPQQKAPLTWRSVGQFSSGDHISTDNAAMIATAWPRFLTVEFAEISLSEEPVLAPGAQSISIVRSRILD